MVRYGKMNSGSGYFVIRGAQGFYGGVGGEREVTPWKELLQRIRAVVEPEPDNRSGFVAAKIANNNELKQRWDTIRGSRDYDLIPEKWSNNCKWWTLAELRQEFAKNTEDTDHSTRSLASALNISSPISTISAIPTSQPGVSRPDSPMDISTFLGTTTTTTENTSNTRSSSVSSVSKSTPSTSRTNVINSKPTPSTSRANVINTEKKITRRDACQVSRVHKMASTMSHKLAPNYFSSFCYLLLWGWVRAVFFEQFYLARHSQN